MQKPLNVTKGSTSLRLHLGYKVPGVSNHELHSQRIGPFKVLEKVGKLAHRIDLSPLIQMHPVVSVVQLEPSQSIPDPYERTQHHDPPLILYSDLS